MAVLPALWGAATHGSLPSDSTEPAIDSLTPESGPEGTVVTIGGSNFGPSIGALQGTIGVSFNGVWSTPTSWSDEEIGVTGGKFSLIPTAPPRSASSCQPDRPADRNGFALPTRSRRTQGQAQDLGFRRPLIQ